MQVNVVGPDGTTQNSDPGANPPGRYGARSSRPLRAAYLIRVAGSDDSAQTAARRSGADSRLGAVLFPEYQTLTADPNFLAPPPRHRGRVMATIERNLRPRLPPRAPPPARCGPRCCYWDPDAAVRHRRTAGSVTRYEFQPRWQRLTRANPAGPQAAPTTRRARRAASSLFRAKGRPAAVGGRGPRRRRRGRRALVRRGGQCRRLGHTHAPGLTHHAGGHVSARARRPSASANVRGPLGEEARARQKPE